MTRTHNRISSPDDELKCDWDSDRYGHDSEDNASDVDPVFDDSDPSALSKGTAVSYNNAICDDDSSQSLHENQVGKVESCTTCQPPDTPPGHIVRYAGTTLTFPHIGPSIEECSDCALIDYWKKLEGHIPQLQSSYQESDALSDESFNACYELSKRNAKRLLNPSLGPHDLPAVKSSGIWRTRLIPSDVSSPRKRSEALEPSEHFDDEASSASESDEGPLEIEASIRANRGRRIDAYVAMLVNKGWDAYGEAVDPEDVEERAQMLAELEMEVKRAESMERRGASERVSA